MNFEKRRYEFVLEAAQPIAHHSGSLGNQAFIMTRKVRTKDGFSRVPIITADTMRHGMREAAAYAFLDAAGMISESLSEAALRLLFAGGMVTGSAGGSVKLSDYRTMCDLVPSLALFGGCAQNRVIPGRLMVDDAMLICVESGRYVPEWSKDFALEHAGIDSQRAHVEEQTRVLMDPGLSPEKRKLLTAPERLQIEARLETREVAADDADAVLVEQSKSSMLPRSYETIVMGSLFSWGVEASTYSELELDTFHVALSAFLYNAQVGGKRATGHGRLRAVAARNVKVLRPSEAAEIIEPTAIAGRVGSVFRAHVAERKKEIRQFLREVAA
jgi:hypothetical protein